jgi:SAM-dependent methyltransferase
MGPESTSIKFDRAADYYDATRALPDAVVRALTDQLVPELTGRGPILEVGVGTGRWAVPLTAAGIDVTGIDLSMPMLLKLREKSDGVGSAVSDACSLPFRDDAFGATYACHLLHLIPNWSDAVREMVRVTRPGGVVLIDHGGPSKLNDAIGTIITGDPGKPLFEAGLNKIEELDAFMDSLGLPLRTLPEVPEVIEHPLVELIERIRSNRWSFTWSLDEDGREQAATRLETWATETFGSVDAIPPYVNGIVWRAYDLPT